VACAGACAGSGEREAEPIPDRLAAIPAVELPALDDPNDPKKPYADDSVRLEAIGSLTSLDDVERALYAPGDFAPLERPRVGDWLDEHPERGQTFEEFAEARYLRPDGKRRFLYIMPLEYPGTSDDPDLETLRELARAFFGVPVKLTRPVPAASMKVTSRMRNGNRQLLAPDILDELGRRIPGDGFLMIALTGEDLYPADDWNFVFGQATLRKRVAVYSTARYQPRFYGAPEGMPNIRETILARTLKVMSHEIGHMFGLEHCVYYRCIMNGSNSILETDRSPHHLCPVCLRKLARAARFDLVDRYEKLGLIYEKLDLAGEAAFVRSRIAGL
jgi:archaemetzincin